LTFSNTLAGALLFSMMLTAAPAQTPPKTALDGVYSASQAEQGKSVYASQCASCHRADLSGFSGPPLKGELFLERWREFNLNVLEELIQRTMPASAPASLTPDKYLNVLAYLLQANGLPAGKKPLGAGALASTLLVGPDGRRPLSSSAQVEVVGCMTLDSGNGFFLTSAGEPARTLDMFSLSAEDLRVARNAPLGNLVFRLENLADVTGFNIDKAVGKKSEAKGVLVRQPKGDRINVTAIDVTGESCAP
jgi:S-disulfanyl-L-cysteine oxidoreductase SoxD